MSDLTQNKYPKDPHFLKAIRKALVRDMRLNDFSWEEEAFELGMQKGTLENKLKPSSINELTMTEVNHIIDLTGNKEPLAYLCEKHGGSFVEHKEVDGSIENIHRLTDDTVLDADKVFRVIKLGLRDGILTEDEISEGEEEIDDVIETLLKLKASLNEHREQS